MNNRRRFYTVLTALLCSISLVAQNTMRIHYKDKSELDIPVSQIDSITIVEKTASEEETSLTGSWLWGKKDAEYYELITFKEDKTYTGYDNYYAYGFDTSTFGFYVQYGNMLTLTSNGYGYQYRYNWYIGGLAANSLSVMTRMGPFTYYKVRPEVVNLSVGDTFVVSEDEECVFADGVVVRLEDGKLTGLTQGETYILIMSKPSQLVWAYKLVVS